MKGSTFNSFDWKQQGDSGYIVEIYGFFCLFFGLALNVYLIEQNTKRRTKQNKQTEAKNFKSSLKFKKKMF